MQPFRYPTAIGSEPNAPAVDAQPAWQTVMRGHTIANGLFVAAVNRTGAEGSVRFYGSSVICDPQVLTRWRDLFLLLYQRRAAVVD